MTKKDAAALLCSVALSTLLAAGPAMAQATQTGPTVPKDPSLSSAGTTAPVPVGPKQKIREARLPPGTYLTKELLPDTVSVLPEPPEAGTPEQADDDATFVRTRALKDTPRWALAARDADLSGQSILDDFDCALGVKIDSVRAPTLAKLLAHAAADMAPEIDRTKTHWARQRPFIGNDQPICVPRDGGLAHSPAYPSGHTTILFGTALILAELAPDRAAQIVQRGRTLSESRIVCGVHWLSDVQAGFIEASTLVAALNGSPAFRADLEKARAELDALRKEPAGSPDEGECRIEADAAAHSTLFRLQPATH